MRIGVDASQANAKDRTGTEWYAFELLHALARIRQEETYTLYLESPLRPDMDLGSGFAPKVLSWPVRRFWHQGRLSTEMAMNPPDVFFAPAHALPLIHPKRAVTTIHDLGFEDHPHLYPSAERLYHRAALRHAVKTASAIIVPSQFTKDRILAYFSVPEERISVIPHGFNPERFQRITDEDALATVRQRYGLNRPYFLFIGRIGQKKNVPNLVRAFARARSRGLVSHDLVLVGGPDFGAEEVDRLVLQEGLSASVRLLGYTPAEVLPALMSLATAFVFVSNYEGFGFPVLESFATGTPVIISRSGSLPEVAQDAALPVRADDVAEIADALAHVAADAQIREELVRKGRARLSAFSWERAAEQTRSVLLRGRI